MHQNFLPLGNKRAVTFNMSDGNRGFQDLLDQLSLKELKILRRYDDLLDRVKEIAKMTEVQLLAEIQDEYSLEVDEYQNQDVWISTEKIEECIPDWFSSSHCGWYIERRSGEFTDWARNLLMQDVRIGVWTKYLEHKSTKKATPGSSVGYGLYL